VARVLDTCVFGESNLQNPWPALLKWSICSDSQISGRKTSPFEFDWLGCSRLGGHLNFILQLEEKPIDWGLRRGGLSHLRHLLISLGVVWVQNTLLRVMTPAQVMV
jgi:hypothetical protein